MSLLEMMEESKRSTAAVYMEFLYRYDPKKKQVFAFYEGDEDSSFYHNMACFKTSHFGVTITLKQHKTTPTYSV